MKEKPVPVRGTGFFELTSEVNTQKNGLLPFLKGDQFVICSSFHKFRDIVNGTFNIIRMPVCTFCMRGIYDSQNKVAAIFI